jgi:hypothetical protein
MEIDSSKPTIVQRRLLPPETRQLRIRATGGGVGLVQVFILKIKRELKVDVVFFPSYELQHI